MRANSANFFISSLESMISCTKRERIKIFFHIFKRTRIFASAKNRVAENLTGAGNFAEPDLPARIGKSQIKKFKRPMPSSFENPLFFSFPFPRPAADRAETPDLYRRQSLAQRPEGAFFMSKLHTF